MAGVIILSQHSTRYSHLILLLLSFTQHFTSIILSNLNHCQEPHKNTYTLNLVMTSQQLLTPSGQTELHPGAFITALVQFPYFLKRQFPAFAHVMRC